MNDTAMLFASIPTMGLYAALVFQLHGEWLSTGAKAEQERKEQERAEIERRRREREELLEWADSLPVDPEPTRTYARERAEPENEPGVTTEWEEVKYS